MSSTDQGGQVLTFDYKGKGKSQDFNRLFYKTLSSGIYEGGELSIGSAGTLNVSPFVCVVKDDSAKIGVRLETTTNVTISNNVDNAHPYVIGQFTWQNTEDNYMEIKCVSYAEMSGLSNILVFGRCVYSGTVLESIDTTRRTIAQVSRQGVLKDKSDFNVTIDETQTNYIKISQGKAYIGGKFVDFSDTVFPIDVNVTNQRIDLVSIDRDGQVVITKSVDSTSSEAPLFPNDMLTIAIITLPSNPTLDGSMIENVYVNNVVQNSSSVDSIKSITSNFTITPSSNERYSINTNDVFVTLNDPKNNLVGCKVELLFKNNAYVTYKNINNSNVTEFINKDRNLTFIFNGLGWFYTPEDVTRTITTKCNTELTQPKEVNIPCATLKDNLTIEVLFENGHYGLTDSESMTLNVNSFGAKPIYVVRDGQTRLMNNHFCTRNESGDNTAHYWFIQSNTFLKLMYNSTLNEGNGGWLVLGNPIVLSSTSETESYEVKANGFIEQQIAVPSSEWVNDGIKTVTYPITFTLNSFAFVTLFGADITSAPIYRLFGYEKNLSSFTFKYSSVRTEHVIFAEGY